MQARLWGAKISEHYRSIGSQRFNPCRTSVGLWTQEIYVHGPRTPNLEPSSSSVSNTKPLQPPRSERLSSTSFSIHLYHKTAQTLWSISFLSRPYLILNLSTTSATSSSVPASNSDPVTPLHLRNPSTTHLSVLHYGKIDSARQTGSHSSTLGGPELGTLASASSSRIRHDGNLDNAPL